MSEQERIQELEKQVEKLQEDVIFYKDLYEKEKQKKVDLDEKVAQVKDVTKKGIDVSKDIFKVTKNVFGKAKETFKEEWDKNRFADEKAEDQKVQWDKLDAEADARKENTASENPKQDDDQK